MMMAKIMTMIMMTVLSLRAEHVYGNLYNQRYVLVMTDYGDVDSSSKPWMMMLVLMILMTMIILMTMMMMIPNDNLRKLN